MNELIDKLKAELTLISAKPKKLLSQNFLIDEKVLQKQIDYAKLDRTDLVLEIGSGMGILTEQLARKNIETIAIEFDEQLANYLKKKFQFNSNIKIIQGDALEIPFPRCTKIISNLPYHISSPLTFKIIENDFEYAILMYQYEFAQRMIAKPNTDDYSRLTVNLQYRANVEFLEKVHRSSFYPVPQVDSALMKITPKKESLPIDPKLFQEISTILFNTKNKLLSSVLYNYFKRRVKKSERYLFRNKMRKKLSYTDNRVRELSVKQLVTTIEELMDYLKKIGKYELYQKKKHMR